MEELDYILISIDGNIGSGKSTTLEDMKRKFPTWHFIDEPVHIWTQFVNENNESLLEVFYKDKKRWSYTFQNVAFMTRTRAINQAIKDWKQLCKTNPEERKNNVFITERCVDTDYHVFAKMLKEDKLIDKMEWDIYRQWYRYLAPDCKVSGIIYVQCNPDKCHERIKQRNRHGEETIPLDYLTQLHQYHEDWINTTSIPTIFLNTEKNLIDSHGNLNAKIGDLTYEEAIVNFINSSKK